MCTACGPFSQCLSFTQPGPVVTWDPRSCPLGSSEASIQSPWDCGPDPPPLPGASGALPRLRPWWLHSEPRPPHAPLAVSAWGGSRLPTPVSPWAPSPAPHPEGLQAPLPLFLLGFRLAACLRAVLSPVGRRLHLTHVSPVCSARGTLHRPLPPCWNVSSCHLAAQWKFSFAQTPTLLLGPSLRASFSRRLAGPLPICTGPGTPIRVLWASGHLPGGLPFAIISSSSEVHLSSFKCLSHKIFKKISKW